MRVMVMVKATPNSERGAMPTEQLLREMGEYNEQLAQAGILLAGEGLKPSSNGVRVHFKDRERRVTDGPFAETKELVAGFWVWQVRSMEEAIEWAKRCPNPMPGEESDLEIRPVYELEDFGDAIPPDVAERERQLLRGLENNA